MGVWGYRESKRSGQLENNSASASRAQIASHAVTWTLAGLCIGALVAHALTSLPYFPDDSYISLRYAKRFANGQGLTWTDGERVEGYSNLLWVLLLSAIGFFTNTFVVPARVLGVVCTAASIIAIFWAHRVTRPARVLPGLFAGLAVASSGAVSAYAIAGLEPPLIVALVTWGLVLTYPILDGSKAARPWAAGLMFGLLAVTRPDGLLFGAAAAFALFVTQGRNAWKPACTLLSVMAIFVVGQLAFRLGYYDAWVPNTYHAKIAFTDQRFKGGLGYLAHALPILTGLLITGAAALAASLFDRHTRRRTVLLLTVAFAWSVHLVAIGGDFFWQHRQIVPLIPVLALLGAEAFAWTASRRPWLQSVGFLVAICALLQLADAARKDPQRQYAIDDKWHFDGRQIGSFLRNAFSEQHPLLAVDAAGCLPYFYELPTLDMLGLTDRHIATHPPPGFGSGFLGHELGDGKYVLNRKPDLIAFWTPAGGDRAQWIGGREMQADPSFYQLYQAVTFDTFDGIRTRLWVRKEDGRIGIQRSENGLVVPGFLLSRRNESVARIDDTGRLGVTILDHAPAELEGMPVPRGTWRVHFEANGIIHSEISVPGPTARSFSGNTELYLVISSETEPVTIRVMVAPGESAHLRSVHFTRLETSARRE